MTVSTTSEEQEARRGVMTSYKDAPTRTVSAGGVDFAYRELGPKAGVPVIFLVHLAGNLDNWDPGVVDGIAAQHRVITFDNRGVGASTARRQTPSRQWPRTPSRLFVRWVSTRSIFTASLWAA